jgi:hypothetical protein
VYTPVCLQFAMRDSSLHVATTPPSRTQFAARWRHVVASAGLAIVINASTPTIIEIAFIGISLLAARTASLGCIGQASNQSSSGDESYRSTKAVRQIPHGNKVAGVLLILFAAV